MLTNDNNENAAVNDIKEKIKNIINLIQRFVTYIIAFITRLV